MLSAVEGLIFIPYPDRDSDRGCKVCLVRRYLVGERAGANPDGNF